MSAIVSRISIAFVIIGSLFSCGRKHLDNEPGSAKKAEYYRGQKIDEIPKTALVESIFKVADTAINQSWSKQTWVVRFGKPSRMETPNNDIQIIEYSDSGPYQPPIARYFLSSAYIKLVNDKTISVSYAHTALE